MELRRHTASDGDVLTPEGIAAAVAISKGAGVIVVEDGGAYRVEASA